MERGHLVRRSKSILCACSLVLAETILFINWLQCVVADDHNFRMYCCISVKPQFWNVAGQMLTLYNVLKPILAVRYNPMWVPALGQLGNYALLASTLSTPVRCLCIHLSCAHVSTWILVMHYWYAGGCICWRSSRCVPGRPRKRPSLAFFSCTRDTNDVMSQK